MKTSGLGLDPRLTIPLVLESVRGHSQAGEVRRLSIPFLKLRY